MRQIHQSVTEQNVVVLTDAIHKIAKEIDKLNKEEPGFQNTS